MLSTGISIERVWPVREKGIVAGLVRIFSIVSGGIRVLSVKAWLTA